MPTIAIVTDDCKNRAQYLEDRKLPVKYMEDFTLLGFVVREHVKACTLLRQAGYTVNNGTVGAEIVLQDASQIRDITVLFTENDITSSFSDIADTIYQA